MTSEVLLYQRLNRFALGACNIREDSLPAAAKFAARCTKRIITVTIKYVIFANKSLILTLTLTLFIVELRKNVERSKFQKGIEPWTYRSAGKYANHSAAQASLEMTYSILLLTHCM